MDSNNPHGTGHRRAPWMPILAIGAVALGLWGIFGVFRGHAPEHGVTERQPETTAPSVESRPDAGAPSPSERIKGTVENIRNEIDKNRENRENNNR
jgi:hypothetical protein